MVTLINPRQPQLNLQSPALGSLFSQIMQQQQDKRNQSALTDWMKSSQMRQDNAQRDSVLGQALNQQPQPAQFDANSALQALVNQGATLDGAKRAIEPFVQQQMTQNKKSALEQLAQDPSRENFYRALPFIDSQLATALVKDRENIATNARELNKPRALNPFETKLFENDAKEFSRAQQEGIDADQTLQAVSKITPLLSGDYQKHWYQLFGSDSIDGRLLDQLSQHFYNDALKSFGSSPTEAQIKYAKDNFLISRDDSEKTARAKLQNIEQQALQRQYKSKIYDGYIQKYGGQLPPGISSNIEKQLQRAYQDPEFAQQLSLSLLTDEQRLQTAERIKGPQTLTENPAPAAVKLSEGLSQGPDNSVSLMDFANPYANRLDDERLKKKIEAVDQTSFGRKAALFGESFLRSGATAAIDFVPNQGKNVENYLAYATNDQRTDEQRRDDEKSHNYQRFLDNRSPERMALNDDEDLFEPSINWPILGEYLKKGRDALFGDYFTPKTKGEQIAQEAGTFSGDVAGLGGLGGFGKLGALDKAKKGAILAGEGLGFAFGKEAAGDSAIAQLGLGLGGAFAGKAAGNLALYPRVTAGKTVAAASSVKNIFKKPSSEFAKAAPAKAAETQRIADIAKKYDIGLSPAVLSEGKPLAAFENFSSKMPFTASAYTREAKKLEVELASTLKTKVFEKISSEPFKGAHDAGIAAQEAALTRLADYKNAARASYKKVDELIANKPNFKFAPIETNEAIAELRPQFNAKDTLSAAEKKVLGIMETIEHEQLRNNGELPLRWSLNYRRTINNLLKETDVRGNIKDLGYRFSDTLSQDIAQAATGYGEWGKELSNTLAESTGLVRTRKKLFDGPIGKQILELGEKPEQILAQMGTVSGAKKIRGILGKDSKAYRSLARAKLEDLFSSVEKDGHFSTAAYSTATNKGKNKELLSFLTGDHYQVIKDTAELTSRIKEKANYLINPSETAFVTKSAKDFSKIAASTGTSFAIFKKEGAKAAAESFAKLVIVPYAGFAVAARTVAHPTFKAAYQKAFLQYQKTGVVNTKTLEALIPKLIASFKNNEKAKRPA